MQCLRRLSNGLARHASRLLGFWQPSASLNFAVASQLYSSFATGHALLQIDTAVTNLAQGLHLRYQFVLLESKSKKSWATPLFRAVTFPLLFATV